MMPKDLDLRHQPPSVAGSFISGEVSTAGVFLSLSFATHSLSISFYQSKVFLKVDGKISATCWVCLHTPMPSINILWVYTKLLQGIT